MTKSLSHWQPPFLEDETKNGDDETHDHEQVSKSNVFSFYKLFFRDPYSTVVTPVQEEKGGEREDQFSLVLRKRL